MLESLQAKALDGMKGQGVEGLTALLASQQEVLQSIAREKAELKPYLDQWERLEAGDRAKLRQGRAGEILDALEAVAQGIQAKHQAMFGDDGSAGPAGASGQAKAEEPAPDLSQTIKFYRGLQ